MLASQIVQIYESASLTALWIPWW